MRPHLHIGTMDSGFFNDKFRILLEELNVDHERNLMRVLAMFGGKIRNARG